MDSTEPTSTNISFPTFNEFEEWLKNRADDAGRLSKLTWMAIAKLSTEGKYTKMTPQEVYADIVKTAEEVYNA